MGGALKLALATGIAGVAIYTTFRGQSWWWRLRVRTRVLLSLATVVAFIAVGYIYNGGY